jgi:hypothetical protein
MAPVKAEKIAITVSFAISSHVEQLLPEPGGRGAARDGRLGFPFPTTTAMVVACRRKMKTTTTTSIRSDHFKVGGFFFL